MIDIDKQHLSTLYSCVWEEGRNKEYVRCESGWRMETRQRRGIVQVYFGGVDMHA